LFPITITTVQLLLDHGAKSDIVNTSNMTQVEISSSSIEKINPMEFELDEKLSSLLDIGSQAVVKVFRRKAELRVHQVGRL
jgi:hypothetical protein